ncbi:MAG: hypothetical protein U9N03_02070 [Candidatus Caldatribacteriota bacterium]|nr:hypothetical protein [Candidatus Caldatribacteriota bacterium]
MNAFTNIIGKNEITVIVEQSKYDNEDVIEIKNGWKILTFDMVLPFGLVGSLAKVSKVFADEKILIFAISLYLIRLPDRYYGRIFRRKIFVLLLF